MGEEGLNIFKAMATIDRRWIYLLVWILVLGPVLRPIGMPIAVTPGTREFYNWLNKLGPDDIVLSVWETGFSAYNELKGGIIAAHRMIIEKGAKMCVVFSTTEGRAIFQMVFGDPERNIPGILTPDLEAHDYKYWEDYIVLGYVFVNDAAVISMGNDFQGYIHNDWEGRPIKGSFLDRIKTAGDFSLIVDFSPGMQTVTLISNYAMPYGTPMIAGAIGVCIPLWSPYLDTGYLKAILATTRGGAELEYLTGHPGPGLQAMDAFTLVHYMLIAFIIIGNIGYFGWSRKARVKEKTAI